jgi:hypothetical protein
VSLARPDNTAPEATGHSAGFFSAWVSVPVARASAWALEYSQGPLNAVAMFATLPKGARTTIIVSKTTFLGAALVGSRVTGQCSAFQAVQHPWGGTRAARWEQCCAVVIQNPRGCGLSHNAVEGAASHPVRPSPCT